MSSALSEVVIGLGIGVESMRAVCMRAGQVTWAREIVLDPEMSLDDSLDSLLASVPRPPLGRVRVVAAVGPARSQLRHLRGLPPVKNAALLSSLVRQDPTRFFLQNGVPVVTTSAQQLDDGTAWAGAIEQPVIEAIERACRRQRWRAPLIAPTAAVLHRVIDDEHIEWRDGQVALMLTRDEHALLECRREVRAAGEDDAAPPVDIASAAPDFGGDTARFADAIGATLLGTRAPLVHRSSAMAGAPVPFRRVAIAGACAIAALAFAFAAPGIAASRAAGKMRNDLATIASASSAATSTERHLAGSVLLLTDLSRFDRSARSMTLALASITRAVRPPTMLLSIRMDSAGGTMVALTPRAMTLLEMLTHVPEISTPTIVGPVLPAAAAPTPGVVMPAMPVPGAAAVTPAGPRTRMEQVTIRFAWTARTSTGMTK